MNDIKQYLEETNTVLLSKETFERLKEKACVLDKISAEIKQIADMEMALMTDIAIDMQDKKVDEVLDKIRSEIEEVYNDRPRSYNHTQRKELFCKIIEIIDKYKAESEE